ncbi:hypothetical protein C8J56DRAFT_1065342 [Mycena floridula]|nr:hypothetical protein C8J56DRAFT_1065342 [Mycena floridula]
MLITEFIIKPYNSGEPVYSGWDAPPLPVTMGKLFYAFMEDFSICELMCRTPGFLPMVARLWMSADHTDLETNRVADTVQSIICLQDAGEYGWTQPFADGIAKTPEGIASFCLRRVNDGLVDGMTPSHLEISVGIIHFCALFADGVHDQLLLKGGVEVVTRVPSANKSRTD